MDVEFVTRKEEKLAICHSMKANDATIRQALVDRFAPGTPNHGKGNKKKPGFFYGFSADMWSAFAGHSGCRRHNSREVHRFREGIRQARSTVQQLQQSQVAGKKHARHPSERGRRSDAGGHHEGSKVCTQKKGRQGPVGGWDGKGHGKIRRKRWWQSSCD